MHLILNGVPRELPAPPGASGAQRDSASLTVAALLAELGVRRELAAVEVNRRIVPRGDHATRLLAPGDEVEIVTLVGGG